MNVPLFFGILIALGLLSLFLGARTAKNVHNSQEAYFLSGRNVRYTALTITILSTQLGGGTLIGISDEAYTKGWIALLYPLGIYAGLLLLSLGIGARLRSKHVTTLPELFEKIYHSKNLRRFAGFLSAFAMLMIFIAQGVASRKFFLALGYDSLSFFLIFWSIIVAYTVVGGLGAVIRIDIIQTIFMASSLLLLLGVSLISIPNLEGLLTTATTGMPEISDYLNWLVMPMLFMIIGQDMGQRCSAAISASTVSKATASAACLYLALALIPTGLGVLAHHLQIPIQEGSSVLLSMIASFNSPSLTAILSCAILMAIISTANSLLCALSTNIAVDIYPHHNVNVGRVVTFISGIAAVLASLLFTNVVPAMLFAYEASIYILFAPIVFSVWLHEPPRWLCFFSLGLGVLCFFLKTFSILSVPMSLLTLSFGNSLLWAIYHPMRGRV